MGQDPKKNAAAVKAKKLLLQSEISFIYVESEGFDPESPIAVSELNQDLLKLDFIYRPPKDLRVGLAIKLCFADAVNEMFYFCEASILKQESISEYLIGNLCKLRKFPRRKFMRISARLNIRLVFHMEKSKEEFRGTSINISAGGLLAGLEESIPEMQLIQLSDHCKKIEIVLDLKGKIIRSKVKIIRYGGVELVDHLSVFDLALEFEDIDPGDRREIKMFVLGLVGRKHKRYNVDLKGLLKWEDEEEKLDFNIKNISASGALIEVRTNAIIHLGKMGKLNISHPDLESFNTLFEIVRSLKKNKEDKETLLGVEFKELALESEQMLMNFCDSLKK